MGSEKTLAEYFDKLLTVFDEVKRTLKPTGTCWVNMGDSFCCRQTKRKGKESNFVKYYSKIDYPQDHEFEFPAKCLMLVPERFAIGMVDRGWLLRNKIIWRKPDCMPSSARDRFTIDYEMVYFFVKSKKYYFKTQYEPYAEGSRERLLRGVSEHHKNICVPGQSPQSISKPRNSGNTEINVQPGRLHRSIWDIPHASCKQLHFATYPISLVKKCLDAGCPQGGHVLDPFAGTGTTSLVAKEMGMQATGIELNPDYVKMAEERNAL